MANQFDLNDFNTLTQSYPTWATFEIAGQQFSFNIFGYCLDNSIKENFYSFYGTVHLTIETNMGKSSALFTAKQGTSIRGSSREIRYVSKFTSSAQHPNAILDLENTICIYGNYLAGNVKGSLQCEKFKLSTLPQESYLEFTNDNQGYLNGRFGVDFRCTDPGWCYQPNSIQSY